MQQVILGALGKAASLDPGTMARHLDGACLKKYYKEVFQEHLRPELSRGGDRVQRMRITYNRLLSQDPVKKRLFDELKFVHYADFIRHGILPSSKDNLARTFAEVSKAYLNRTFDPYVVFISYRWIGAGAGSESTTPCPDDTQHTQYK